MLRHRLFGVLAVALATLLFDDSSALAGMVSGSIAVGAADVTTSSPGGINSDTVFTMPTIFASGTGTGDFSALSFPDGLGNAILDPAAPTTFSFGTTAFGYFHGVSIVPSTGPGTESFQILGTFTPGTDEAGTTPSSASLTVSFTQNGGPGMVISGSGTLNTLTLPSVPEPSSALLGFSAFVAVGLFHVVRRCLSTV